MLRQRLKSWWQALWRKKWLFIFLFIYKILEDWGLGKLVGYIQDNSGVFVNVLAIIGDFLPRITWVVVPIVTTVLIVRAYKESVRVQSTSDLALTPSPPIDADEQPNVALSACFVERVYLQYYQRGDSPYGYADIAFAEFRNKPSSRLPNTSARRVNATISYFAADKSTPLLDRNIVGLFKRLPVPEVITVYADSGLIAYPDENSIEETVDFLYTGKPWGLFVVIRHQDEKECYAIDSKHFRQKTPSYKIAREEIHVRVKLTGDKFEREYMLNLHTNKKGLTIS